MKWGLFKAFGRDSKGTVAIVFAFTMIPLLGFAGLATDYAKSVLVKRRMELAIDSAALAAVRRTVDIINEGKRSQAEAITAGEKEGQAYLDAQSSHIMDSSLGMANVKVKVDKGTITSEVHYQAGVPTVFARLFGVNDFNLDGVSGATMTLPPYVDVHVLVDISQSMGIGATEADQEIIRNMKVRRFDWKKRTTSVEQNGCAFGCHILQSEYKSFDPRYPSKSTYEVAHENGARMRIDVVRDAVQKLSASLLSREDKRYRVAVHTFHSTSTTLLTLTGNATVAAAAISGIGPSTRAGGTNAHEAFKYLNDEKKVLKKPGDGLTRETAQAIVVIMTDGTEDTQMEFPEKDGITWDPNFVYFNPTAGDGGGTIQSFDPKMCSSLKEKGVRVIAMNTKYMVPPKDSNPKFTAIKDWLHKYIESNMALCVSSKSDYYDASSPSDIDSATQQIISSIAKPLALTR